jgi:hypothetical protein
MLLLAGCNGNAKFQLSINIHLMMMIGNGNEKISHSAFFFALVFFSFTANYFEIFDDFFSFSLSRALLIKALLSANCWRRENEI